MSYPVPSNENQRLEALRRYHILDTPPEPAFDDFAKLASYIAGTPIATVTLVDAQRQWFKARVGVEKNEDTREVSFCAHALFSDEILIVEDAATDVRFAGNPLVTGAPHIRFYAGAPLINSEGFALGTLCVIDQRPRHLTDEQYSSLRVLARRVMEHFEVRLNAQHLAKALEEVKTLQGLLPICSHCKSVRNDDGYWSTVETYISTHSDANFSHGICPTCLQIHHPQVYARMREQGRI